MLHVSVLGWPEKPPTISHRIHGTGVFTYIYHRNQPNVGQYTSPMDPIGIDIKCMRLFQESWSF